MPIISVGSGSRGLKRIPVILANRVSVVKISGITKDSTGAALADVVVDLYQTVNDVFVNTTTSDAVGAYAFDVVNQAGAFYIVAYKAGAPDVAGTTVNTLVGV